MWGLPVARVARAHDGPLRRAPALPTTLANPRVTAMVGRHPLYFALYTT
jgi:hypothetical protein